MPRLSHPQWENTTRDLLLLEARSGKSSAFIGDAQTGVFDNDGADLSVGEVLAGDYRRAAEELADEATRDVAQVDALMPPDAPTEPSARVAAFVRHFGARAYRRPLTDEEASRLEGIAADASTHFPTLDPVVGGVRLVIEAVLQAPHFLYRPELTPADGASVRLSSHEIASRLSYALWNSMPDDELFAAAEADLLTDVEAVRGQAERMLEDPRAHDMVGRFHHQWIEAHNFVDITRSTSLFPEFDPALPLSMEQELLRFVEAVVFEEEGGFELLMTADWTYVDPLLARVYGVDPPAADWERVSLDPTQRAGVLTQIGFLASQSTSTDPDAIHRGVHINRRVLCAELPPPPMMVPPLPDEDPSVPQTLRQRIDSHTGVGTCGARCHGAMINPVGFAYEHFDALGRWRTTDNDLPVDAMASYRFETGERSYDGASDLAQVIVDQPSSHDCYVGFWLEYLYGRRQQQQDSVLVRRLGAASHEAGLSVRETILELVTSEAFLSRSSRELEDAPADEGDAP